MLLLAGFGPLIAQVNRSAQVRLTETVDENWRGAYDILVRPAGARSGVEAADDLVEPNFLMFTGGGGISLRTWRDIQQISDVELVAPVAVVGFVRLANTAPLVYIPPDTPAGAQALYRMDVTIYTSDGIEDRLLSVDTGFGVLPLSDGTVWHDQVGHTGGVDGGALVEFPASLEVSSPLLAVDPGAESALIGDSVFSPLSQAGECPTVGDFDSDLVLPEYVGARAELHFAREGGGSPDQPVLPLVVADHMYAPLWAELQVYRVGDDLSSDSSQNAPIGIDEALTLRSGADLTEVGRTEIDVAALARPFRAVPISLSWPGTTIPPEEGLAMMSMQTEDWFAQLPQPLDYAPVEARPGSSAVSLRLVSGADGHRSVDGVALTEQPTGLAVSDLPFYIAPVGTFDLANIDLPNGSLNWAPLGAYDPPESLLVAAADGTPVDEQPMTPSLDVTSLVQPPPLAFTSICSAEILRGPTPIDAIRVRVGGLAGFDAASRGRVEAVASEIASMGLDVDIVAGSSPREVEIYVPGYYDDGSDLGWVRQHWSTLGAAEHVTEGLSSVNRNLLWLSVSSALVVVVGLQLVKSEALRSEAATLFVLGWRRRRAAWWLAEDGVLAALLVLAVGVGSYLTWAGDRVAVTTVAAMAVCFGAAAALAAMLATQDERAGSHRLAFSRHLPFSTTTPPGLSLRALLAAPVESLASAVALAVGVAGTVLAAWAVVGASGRAGPTLLAEASAGLLAPYQVGIVALAGAANSAMFLLLMRRAFLRRERERAVLEVVGTRSGRIRTVGAWYRLYVAAAAAPIAGLVVLAVGVPGSRLVPVYVAAICALASVVWAAPATWSRHA